MSLDWHNHKEVLIFTVWAFTFLTVHIYYIENIVSSKSLHQSKLEISLLDKPSEPFVQEKSSPGKDSFQYVAYFMTEETVLV